MSRPNRDRRAVTLVEVMIGVGLLAILSYFIYSLMHVAVRRTSAGDRKNQTARAALDVADRLRRDLRWAVEAKLDPSGDSLVLKGDDGSLRTWSYDHSRFLLRLPAITMPTSSEPYRLAKFRRIRFTQPNPVLVRFLVSALPIETPEAGPTAEDVKFSTTVCGEVALRRQLGLRQNPLWNGR